ncbi:MAG: flagellar FlbD family protein [Chloroflexota bacterium]
MIGLTRLDGAELVVNAELIELIEATPDTVISLSNGRKLIVRESVAEIIDKVLDFKRSFHQRWRQQKVKSRE